MGHSRSAFAARNPVRQTWLQGQSSSLPTESHENERRRSGANRLFLGLAPDGDVLSLSAPAGFSLPVSVGWPVLGPKDFYEQESLCGESPLLDHRG